jgi:hypothetical protein
MSKVLKRNEVLYFRISIKDIPLKELSIDTQNKYAYCRFYNTSGITGEQPGFNVVGIYNYFTSDPLDDHTILLSNEWLFGEVLSYDPPLRKEGKWEIIGREPIDKEGIVMPYFKTGKDDTWFYIKDGIYHIFTGIKTTKDKVWHLERPYLYGVNAIKLRIVVELLKKEPGKAGISLEEWNEIGFKVLRSDPINANDSDEELRFAVERLLPNMLEQPIYSELPQHIRGKLNE